MIGLFLGTLIGLRLFRSPSAFLLLVASMLIFPVVASGGFSEITSAREFGGAIVAVLALAFLSGFTFVMPASAAVACVMVRWTFLGREESPKCDARITESSEQPPAASF